MQDKNVDSLSNILSRTATVGTPSNGHAAPPEESDALTLAEMSGTAMRPANKNLTRLHVIKKDGKVFTFQYHFLDARSTFEGGAFTLLFCGAKHWELTVKGHGPKFWMVYDFLTLHRWPYLREAVRDMADEGETVFTSIEIKDVTPKPE